MRELTPEEKDALGELGQFYLTRGDLAFLLELIKGRAKRPVRDKWFLANERRPVWFVAQGILANVYGEDPP